MLDGMSDSIQFDLFKDQGSKISNQGKSTVTGLIMFYIDVVMC